MAGNMRARSLVVRLVVGAGAPEGDCVAGCVRVGERWREGGGAEWCEIEDRSEVERA